MAVYDDDRDITFEIIEEIGIISTVDTGWTKELNLVRWNGGVATSKTQSPYHQTSSCHMQPAHPITETASGSACPFQLSSSHNDSSIITLLYITLQNPSSSVSSHISSTIEPM